MKKKAIVIGGTKKDFIPMAVFVINVKETNPNLVDEIVIFHDGISEKNQMLFNKIFKCRFILYSFPGYDPNNFNDYVNKYFSPMVFCRYECLRLLDEYSVIIWSDYDVVILKNISELLEPCHSSFKLVEDDIITPASIFDTFLPSIKQIHMDKYNLSINMLSSAILVLFDNLKKYNEMYNWCIKTTIELGKHLYLTELSIFNLLLQEFNLKANTLKASIYCPHPIKGTINNETKIIHAYGQPKFWNGLKNEIWESNYRYWIKIGGSKIKERLILFRIYKFAIRVMNRIKKLLVKSYDSEKNNS